MVCPAASRVERAQRTIGGAATCGRDLRLELSGTITTDGGKIGGIGLRADVGVSVGKERQDMGGSFLP